VTGFGGGFDDTIAAADRELARLEEVQRAQAEEEAARRAAVRQYRRRRQLAVFCACFGLLWQVGAHHPWVMSLPGVALVVYGCVQEAKAKSWHPAWAVLGVLPLLGLIAVFLLPNRTPLRYRMP
jgi:hypothetical protein